MAKLVKCPHCGKDIAYSSENPFRPFCSERCQLIDLGNWADGSYSIPEEEKSPTPAEIPDDEEESAAPEQPDGRLLH